jgi:hypothetical protein
MVQKNIAIAIIIIVLFIVLALVAFGIYYAMRVGQRLEGGGSSSSSGSESRD